MKPTLDYIKGEFLLHEHKSSDVIVDGTRQDIKSYTDAQIAALPKPFTYKGTIVADFNYTTMTGLQVGWVYVIKADGAKDVNFPTITYSVDDEIVWLGSSWDLLGSLTNLDGAHLNHGIESFTASTWSNTTKILTLPACTYWYFGTKVICSANITVDLTALITANGAYKTYFIYFDDLTGVLKASITPWNVADGQVMVDAIYWNGTAGALTREKHNHTRNRDWHKNAHLTIGARYASGLALSGLGGTGATATWQIASGATMDEDLYHTINTYTQASGGARVWYEAGAGQYTFIDQAYYMLWNSGTGRTRYPNTSSSYALTDLANNRFQPIWVYAAGGDKDRQIYFVIPSIAAASVYTSATNARAATPPDLSSLGWSQEVKLIHKIIMRGDGVADTYVASTDDLRTTASLPSGGGFSGVIPAASVGIAELKDELKGSITISASDINWVSGVGFPRLTLTGTTSLTFSNLSLYKTISGEITGNFTLTLPAYCNKISGTYDGTKINLFQFYCTNNVSGSESVWYTISQPA